MSQTSSLIWLDMEQRDFPTLKNDEIQIYIFAAIYLNFDNGTFALYR